MNDVCKKFHELVKQFVEWSGELRSLYLTIDAVIKLHERGIYGTEDALEKIKLQTEKLGAIFDELRAKGF